MSMGRVTCDDFKKFIDAYLDEEFDARDRADFDAHVALCGCCRRRVEDHLSFRRCIRTHMQQKREMPADARARLQARMRTATRPDRAAKWLSRMAAPLPAVAAVGAVALFYIPMTGFAPVVNDAVGHHCDRVPIEVPTPEAREVDEWFRDKLPFELAAPRFEDDQVMLLGGRLSKVGGGDSGLRSRRAAYLVYGVGPHKLTVLVFDGKDLEVDDDSAIREVNGRRLAIHHDQDRGYNVALYRKGNLTYAYTSDLPETDLLRLVANAH
jgi:anti-sigma factor RsiW